ncbi:unnamed protein product [Prunus armeniaca]|uniref:Uncharacterized protein n=1 Tax=Prunus armeniaca TaxID=36596 RepID=A0A6J5UHB9_PRUAR|nr:unnamed protein product [Prunus armeniaca]
MKEVKISSQNKLAMGEVAQLLISPSRVLIYVASLVEMTKEELAEVTYQNAREGGKGENGRGRGRAVGGVGKCSETEEELFANEIAGGDVRDAEVGEARGIGAFANVWEGDVRDAEVGESRGIGAFANVWEVGVRDAEVGESRGIGAFANVWEVGEDPWTFMSVMLHKKRIFVDDKGRCCDVNFRI